MVILLSLRKGVFSIDFFIASTLFLVVLFSFNSMWMRESNNVYSTASQEKIKLSAEAFSSSLVLTPGSPSSWSHSNFNSLGLAAFPNVLVADKVEEFLLINYEDVMQFTGFDFFVNASFLNGTSVFSKGAAKNSSASSVERFALFNNEIIKVRVVLYA
ncbi:MAG: hypothetical protein ABH803_00075 [Candidatus Micrarchaeota archaeon]